MTRIFKSSGLLVVLTVVALGVSPQSAQAGLRYPTERTLWDWVNGARYLAHWPVIRDATAYASAEADRRYPNDAGNNNGPRNAFKHACWAAILTSALGDAKHGKT